MSAQPDSRSGDNYWAMHVIDRGLPDITIWATWAAQGSRPKAVEILAEVPQGSLLQQATLEPIKSRLQSALEAHGICDCLPASDCREDRTLRKAKTPEVTDCRVEPPPPQRRDPF